MADSSKPLPQGAPMRVLIVDDTPRQTSPLADLSDHSKMMYYRAVLRRIATNEPDENRRNADALAMAALDRFGDL